METSGIAIWIIRTLIILTGILVIIRSSQVPKDMVDNNAGSFRNIDYSSCYGNFHNNKINFLNIYINLGCFS